MEHTNHLHEPVKLNLKQPGIKIKYISDDGESFYDLDLYRKHQYKLNLEKLRIIHEPHFFNDNLHWYTPGIFIVGYLFGWFCNFTSR